MESNRLEVPEPEKETATVVYVGASDSPKGKLTYGYLQIEDDWNDGRAITVTSNHQLYTPDGDKQLSAWQFDKRFVDVLPGAVLTFDLKKGAHGGVSIYTKSGKVKGTWANDHDRALWQARSSAIISEHNRQKALKAEANVSLMLKGLDPIRRAYGQLPRRSQAALLAEVIAYIAGTRR